MRIKCVVSVRHGKQYVTKTSVDVIFIWTFYASTIGILPWIGKTILFGSLVLIRLGMVCKIRTRFSTEFTYNSKDQ